MKHKTLKILFGLVISLNYSLATYAAKPIFTITPTLRAPTQVVAKTNAITYYNVQNTGPRTFTDNGVVDLPSGVTQITTGSESNICQSRFDLNVNQSCLLKLNINSSQIGQVIKGGPVVCSTPEARIYCYQPVTADQLNTTIVAQPSPDVTLSMPPSIFLMPEATVPLNITNTSSSTYINNIQLLLPSSIVSEIQSITPDSACLNLAPAQTCNINIIAKGSADASKCPVTATAQSSNSQNASTILKIGSGLTAASPTYFTQGGIQSLTLTNNTSSAVSITNVALPISIHNLTLNSSLPLYCPANNTCDLAFNVGQNASGSGDSEISYNIASGSTQRFTPTIAIATPVISINDGNNIILKTDASSKKITIKNDGPFDWQSPKLTFAPLSGVTFSTDCPSTSLAAGSYCSATFTSNGAIAGDGSTLIASGTNISSVPANVFVSSGLNIGLDNSPANQHLLYRAIKIENTSNYKAIITEMAFSPGVVKGELKICHKSGTADNDCSYRSTCDTGTSLGGGQSCLCWIKALDGTIPLGNLTKSENLVIAAQLTSSPALVLFKNFAVQYGRYLFVGGSFTAPGTSPAQNIAKWDASNWTQVGSTFLGPKTKNGIGVLTEYKGDLFASRNTIQNGNDEYSSLVKWNGITWETVANVSEIYGESSIYALTKYQTTYDESLYVGGYFSSLGNLSANNIAKWNGAAWSALGTGTNNIVKAITIQESPVKLIAGGSFTAPFPYAAAWIEGAFAWEQLGNNLTSKITALFYQNINQSTYAGGGIDKGPVSIGASSASWIKVGAGLAYDTLTFTRDNYGSIIAGTDAAADNSVYKWNGTAWLPLTGLSGTALTLTQDKNGNLFAGGNFVGSHIMQWNGNVWNGVGSNLDGAVQSSIILPSIISVTPLPLQTQKVVGKKIKIEQN